MRRVSHHTNTCPRPHRRCRTAGPAARSRRLARLAATRAATITVLHRDGSATRERLRAAQGRVRASRPAAAGRETPRKSPRRDLTCIVLGQPECLGCGQSRSLLRFERFENL
jgi:hypothetical protein